MWAEGDINIWSVAIRNLWPCKNNYPITCGFRITNVYHLIISAVKNLERVLCSQAVSWAMIKVLVRAAVLSRLTGGGSASLLSSVILPGSSSFSWVVGLRPPLVLCYVGLSRRQPAAWQLPSITARKWENKREWVGQEPESFYNLTSGVQPITLPDSLEVSH